MGSTSSKTSPTQSQPSPSSHKRHGSKKSIRALLTPNLGRSNKVHAHRNDSLASDFPSPSQKPRIRGPEFTLQNNYPFKSEEDSDSDSTKDVYVSARSDSLLGSSQSGDTILIENDQNIEFPVLETKPVKTEVEKPSEDSQFLDSGLHEISSSVESSLTLQSFPSSPSKSPSPPPPPTSLPPSVEEELSGYEIVKEIPKDDPPEEIEKEEIVSETPKEDVKDVEKSQVVEEEERPKDESTQFQRSLSSRSYFARKNFGKNYSKPIVIGAQFNRNISVEELVKEIVCFLTFNGVFLFDFCLFLALKSSNFCLFSCFLQSQVRSANFKNAQNHQFNNFHQYILQLQREKQDLQSQLIDLVQNADLKRHEIEKLQKELKQVKEKYILHKQQVEAEILENKSKQKDENSSTNDANAPSASASVDFDADNAGPSGMFSFFHA